MAGVLLATILSFILYVILALIAIINNGKKGSTTLKKSLTILVVGYVLWGGIMYLALPAITVPNMALTNAIVALVLAPVLYFSVGSSINFKKPHRSAGGIVIIVAVLVFPTLFITGILTVDDSYQSIDKKEAEEAKPLNEEDTPITVSPEFARNKVQKAMSVVPNTQFYDLGKLQVQKVNEDIVYVAPVEFTSFWKYIRGKETEGYFTISATNVNAQPEFVKSKMKYTNSSYFNKNVQRTIYNDYPDYIQSGEAQIEVDDEGKPWYVQTLYKPITITNKPNMETFKVAVIDPVSGNLEIYDTTKAPEFIDSPISSEMAAEQNSYFGKYIHGWLNSIFGKKDVKIPNEQGTEHSVTPIFDEDGKMFYFTDMSSPKENIDSALGYTLVNANTGALTYFNGKKNNGIMDSKGAIQIVNKEFPEKNWEGSMPILYNIDGNPTWIVNVLDPNGLFKQYAYIKASDSDFVVFGDTARETLAAYRLQIAQDPSNVSASEEVEAEEKTGKVTRVLVTSRESGQVVQFLLENDKTIYTVHGSNAPLAIFMKAGDQVQLKVKTRPNGTSTVEEITIKGLTN